MRPRSVAALTWVAAGLLAGFWLGAIFGAAARTGDPGDFSAFYGGARVLRTVGPRALYDFPAMERITRASFPGPYAVLPFIRPPFYALLLQPLAVLPPHAALLAWLVLNAAALLGSVFLLAGVTGREAPVVAWHAAIFFPALAAFFNRQDVPLLLLAATLAYRLLNRGRPFAAGLALAACTVKFHLGLLLPLVLVVQRSWRLLAGLAAGAGVALALSLLLVGPSGCWGYVRMLFERTAPNIENYPERQANLSSVARDSGLEIPLVLLTAAAAAAAGRRLQAREALAAGWLGSLAIAPHAVISDYLLALPALLLLAPLGRACFVPGVLLLFPVVPLLLVWDERLIGLAPLLALACLLGAVIHGSSRRSEV